MCDPASAPDLWIRSGLASAGQQTCLGSAVPRAFVCLDMCDGESLQRKLIARALRSAFGEISMEADLLGVLEAAAAVVEQPGPATAEAPPPEPSQFQCGICLLVEFQCPLLLQPPPPLCFPRGRSGISAEEKEKCQKMKMQLAHTACRNAERAMLTDATPEEKAALRRAKSLVLCNLCIGADLVDVTTMSPV